MKEFEAVLFSSHSSYLGESPSWSDARNSIFWLDIDNSLIFEKHVDSSSADYDQVWKCPYTPSTLLPVAQDPDRLLVVCDIGVCYLDLTDNAFHLLKKLDLLPSFRTNDACITPCGNLIFGTMEREPSGAHGQIYIFDGHKYSLLAEGIGIPNAFSWYENYLYIADSLTNKIYKCCYDSSKKSLDMQLWLSDASEHGVFDGAASDPFGVWYAKWGGSCLTHLSKKAHIDAKIHVPELNVTSCCFAGIGSSVLFITSASQGREGAGKVYKVELEEYSGCEVNEFVGSGFF